MSSSTRIIQDYAELGQLREGSDGEEREMEKMHLVDA